MGEEDTPFILSLVFQFEYEIEARNFLLNVTIVAPANFVQVFRLDEAVHDAFTKLSLSTREIPLGKADSLTRLGVLVLENHLLRVLDIKQRVESLDRQEGTIPRVAFDLRAKAFLKRLLKLPCLVPLLINRGEKLSPDVLRSALFEHGTRGSVQTVLFPILQLLQGYHRF